MSQSDINALFKVPTGPLAPVKTGVSVGTLEQRLLSVFPAEDACTWDRTGLTVGNPGVEVTGVVVAAGGVIGFIGFIVPHIIRILVGADHRRVFPLSFIGGSLFLLWMDVLARTIMAPQELAVGIFTAFCGGPFFVWLLYRKNKYGRM